VFSRENGIISIGIHSEKFCNMYLDSWFPDTQGHVFLDIHDRHGAATPSAVYQRLSGSTL